MIRSVSFKVTEPARLDRFLTAAYGELSRSQIQKCIAAGRVRVGEEVVTEPSRPLDAGISISFLPPEPDPDMPAAEARPLDILFEDDALLVLNKPAGMVTHPNSFYEKGTLVQAVLAHAPQVAQAVYDPSNPVSRLRPGIVHRLDKETSGLIVVAKTTEALQAMAAQFHKRSVRKTYETVLYGSLMEPKEVNAPIKRKGGSKNMMVASHTPDDGRPAQSVFQPLRTFAPYPAWPQEVVTHCQVAIATGRTHQIRVHAKFIGHPVLGDQLYSNKPSRTLSEKLGVRTQLLHASRLEFQHPGSGETLIFTTQAPFLSLFPH